MYHCPPDPNASRTSSQGNWHRRVLGSQKLTHLLTHTYKLTNTHIHASIEPILLEFILPETLALLADIHLYWATG